ncbi:MULTISPECIES: hypothetical protein [unclassified Corynebacterium]|uniref:hypothetical protein n=1 Tax=unclassified Corynebacterium TaxID=2624378 RepID=UPI000A62E882|nr:MULTISPECIES: hypothetical protein [unclassified Corynebacterium]MDK8243552.1 hypothetical protein [Corynebacterium sp. UMB10321]
MGWANEITNGTVSGLISGLLVAFTLGFIERTARPRLELRRIDNGTALLRNNGFCPVVFGDTFALEKGTDLIFPKDGFRGHICEMSCKGRGEIVVGCAISLGESLSLTYKPVWTDKPLSARHWRRIHNQAQQADVMAILERKYKPWWTLNGFKLRLTKTTPAEFLSPTRLWGWKLTELPLKPM